jgi:hypothetical protein
MELKVNVVDLPLYVLEALQWNPYNGIESMAIAYQIGFEGNLKGIHTMELKVSY